MPQTKQTPRVWSDAIPGSEILANWTKLGISAVFLWLSIGIVLGIAVGGWWFLTWHDFAGAQAIGSPYSKRHWDRWADS